MNSMSQSNYLSLASINRCTVYPENFKVVKRVHPEAKERDLEQAL